MLGVSHGTVSETSTMWIHMVVFCFLATLSSAAKTYSQTQPSSMLQGLAIHCYHVGLNRSIHQIAIELTRKFSATTNSMTLLNSLMEHHRIWQWFWSRRVGVVVPVTRPSLCLLKIWLSGWHQETPSWVTRVSLLAQTLLQGTSSLWCHHLKVLTGHSSPVWRLSVPRKFWRLKFTLDGWSSTSRLSRFFMESWSCPCWIYSSRYSPFVRILWTSSLQ